MTFNKVGNRLTYQDVQELPKELLEQLQLSKSGDLGDLIIKIIRDDYEGVANIDEVLVAIYKRTQKIEKRVTISNKLYRMSKKGFLQAVEGKKGAYKITTVKEGNIDDSDL